MKKYTNIYENDLVYGLSVKKVNLFTEFINNKTLYPTIPLRSVITYDYAKCLDLCHKKQKMARKLERKIREVQNRLKYKTLEKTLINISALDLTLASPFENLLADVCKKHTIDAIRRRKIRTILDLKLRYKSLRSNNYIDKDEYKKIETSLQEIKVTK